MKDSTGHGFTLQSDFHPVTTCVLLWGFPLRKSIALEGTRLFVLALTNRGTFAVLACL